MNFHPLTDASLAIQLHTYGALAATAVGALQFVAPKGRRGHRLVGWGWAGLMVMVALSSFWIHEINQWAGLSLIHLLSVLVLVTVPMAVWAARTGRLTIHRKAMVQIYLGALVVAGLFTLLPGRIMHRVVVGG